MLWLSVAGVADPGPDAERLFHGITDAGYNVGRANFARTSASFKAGVSAPGYNGAKWWKAGALALQAKIFSLRKRTRIARWYRKWTHRSRSPTFRRQKE